jgi:amino acid adenylation domain-containing protein
MGWDFSDAKTPWEQLMTDGQTTVLDRWLSQAPVDDTPALRDHDLTRSYRELLETAQRRAAFFLSQGLQPDQRVVVILNSGVEQATWIAAVMLAGGCAVPVGLNQPEQRLRTLIELARPTAVIVDPATWPLADGQVRYDGTHRGADLSDRLPRAGRDWAAYICFTSGTTGQPKGVIVTHGVLAHTIGEIAAYHGLGNRARTHVLATSWSFDVAMMDLWLALTTGGTLFMPGRDALLGPALPALLSGIEAAILHTVPSLFSASSADDLSSLPKDITVIVGGESAPASLLATLADHSDLHVAYGITETGVITTMAPGRPGMGPDIIGRPLPGSDCTLTDAAGRPVPDGELGELLIGGPVVARGYLGDPAGTAARFLPGEKGLRRYRTGDLVRRRPDGMLSYHGRIDQQVKIRGHRVEPNEVEQVLLNLPGVRQAAVVAREDLAGERVLVAYLVGDDLEVNTVRRECGVKMPEWMCPGAIQILPTLPITATGKIERRALPMPSWTGDADDGASALGQLSDTEQMISRMWQQVLGTHAVTADANFIALGGHSLKAAQISTALRDLFGVSVKAHDVISMPSLRDLAQLVDRQAGVESDRGMTPSPGRRREASALQRRIWRQQELAGNAGIHNAVVTVRLTGRIDLAALRRSLHAVELLHAALRTSFVSESGKLIAFEHSPASRPLAIRNSSLPEAIRDAGASALQISGGVLWRYELVSVTPTESVLLLVFHHIAVDRTAIQFLLQEIAERYSGASGRTRAMPSDAHEFGPETRVSGDNLDFWTRLLKDAPEPASLPGQLAARDTSDFSSWCRSAHMAGMRASVLRQTAARAGATLHTLLLSAFLRTVAKAVGTVDLIIGVPISLRGMDVAYAATVGQFVSVLPIRFALPADLSPSGCLAVVVHTMQSAQQHCAVDPEAVLATIRADYERAPDETARIVFASQEEAPTAEFAGLESSWAMEVSGYSAYDLAFDFTARRDVITGRVTGRRASCVDIDVPGIFRDMTENVDELWRVTEG